MKRIIRFTFATTKDKALNFYEMLELKPNCTKQDIK